MPSIKGPWKSVYKSKYGTSTQTGENVFMSSSDSKSSTQRTHADVTGFRPPTPYSRVGYKSTEMYASFVEAGTGGSLISYSFNGPASQRWFGDLSRYASVPSRFKDISVDKALASLSGQVNIPEDVAEHQQTADMIGGVGRDISKTIKKFKRDHPREWLQVLRSETGRRQALASIPKRWLEVQYGWVPLLLDAKEGFDLMKHLDSDSTGYRVTGKGYFHDSVRDQTYSRYNHVNLDNSVTGQVRVRYDDRIGAFTRLDYAVENPNLHAIQQLGVANPVDLAWELLPYSFVVDWFVPIGAYLRSWTATLGLRFLGGSTSTMARRDVRWDSLKGPYTQTSVSASPGYLSSYRMVREVYSTSPLPRLPSVEPQLSLQRFASGMSLLSLSLNR